MPCDEWKTLAQKVKEAKLQRSYLVSNQVTGISESQRKKRLREQTRSYVDVSRRADEHRHQCPTCKGEPESHFHDLDPQDGKPNKRVFF
jgi:hypothetical protein